MYSNVQEAGFGWIRLYLPWNEIERTPGVYNWGPYGDAIELAQDMGLKVLAVLSAPPPCWAAQPDCAPCQATPPGTADGCLPKDNKVFRAFAAAAVKELATSTWGLWQEPNYLLTLPGAQDARRRYQELVLGPGFDGVKDAFPEAKVTAPGLIIAGGERGCHEVTQWVNKPGTTELVRPFDAITVHTYDTSDRVVRAVDCIDSLERQWSTTKVWLEEFGFGDHGSSCVQPLEEPGLAAAKVLDRAWSRNVQVFLWDLIGDDSGPGVDCAYGLYDNGGTLRKEKFCSIKKLLYERTGKRMRVADPCFSTKFSMDWLHRFGDVRARPPVVGALRGSGRDEVFVIDPVDHSSWVGALDGNNLRFSKVGDASPDIETHGLSWAGYFTESAGPKVLLFNSKERSWLLGTFSGGQVTYSRVAHTGHLGGVEDGAQFWVGRFSGSERHELMFWSPKDKTYRLGRIEGGSLIFKDVGQGEVGDKVLVNDFLGLDHPQLLSWSEKDDNVSIGTVSGDKLAWRVAGSTRGLEREDARYIWTGKFDGGLGQALFRVPTPSASDSASWWLGEWRASGSSGAMKFVRAASVWDHRLGFVSVGDFEGVREDRLLLWVPGSNAYYMGKQDVAVLRVSKVGEGPPLSRNDGKDLLVWSGTFTEPVKESALVWNASTGDWWLAALDAQKKMQTVHVGNTGSTQ